MGSIVLNNPQLNHRESSYIMLGGAVPSSESVYRPSSRQSARPSSHLESGHSISKSSSSTPGPTHVQRHSSSMTSTAPGHTLPSGPNPHSVAYSSQTSGHDRGLGNVTTGPGGRHRGSQSSPASPQLRPTYQSLRSLGGSEASSPSRIKIRDLSHIQSFASEEFLAQSQRAQVPESWAQERQFEISSMPVTDIIEMVAGLLTKITATNDAHHEQVHRNIPSADGSSNLSQQAQSVLAFHGKNVPSISILNYLTRIHKYCPTTYEVFLSLLVYFDRMTEMVNKGQIDRLRRRWSRKDALQSDVAPRPGSSETSTAQRMHTSPLVTPPSSASITARDPTSPSSISPTVNPQREDDQLSHYFVVDSYNIHRLVIAGVTCASKFFSDVFYTNSRYAKVGGLPLVELNHLELQFLLLNDFRLSIPVEELEAYGTMLVEFYAREIVAQQQRQPQAGLPRSLQPPSAREAESEGIYMRSRDPRQPEVRQTATPP
ncbi:cyclin-domain-containing protein [Aspergillus egyptiacus]|nr:cyclin-domain-containing protein [Aspergillus egyptiacus]